MHAYVLAFNYFQCNQQRESVKASLTPLLNCKTIYWLTKLIACIINCRLIIIVFFVVLAKAYKNNKHIHYFQCNQQMHTF